MTSLLLCTDLDRTLIPNGTQPESPGARQAIAELARHRDVTLVYVTGRHLALTEHAIRRFSLPWPDIAITDVGTAIFEREGERWRSSEAWTTKLALDWRGVKAHDLHAHLADLRGLVLQAPSRQSDAKLSFTTGSTARHDDLLAQITARLEAAGVAAAVVWSVDEAAGVGLIDVIPRHATKLHAIQFVAATRGTPLSNVVFAGDSGNDLDVLASDIPAVLVANAHDDVRREALRLAALRGTEEQLFIARDGPGPMNGNYAAGILAGVAHFRPEFMIAGLIEGAR